MQTRTPVAMSAGSYLEEERAVDSVGTSVKRLARNVFDNFRLLNDLIGI